MPKINLDDTIAAVATPAGEGGISVIRISGRGALETADIVFRGKGKVSSFTSHTVHLGYIHARDGEKIDQVLLTVFRAPNSYTGEDVVEISSHGGMAVTRTVLELVMRSGARPADPGEFTKRAFLTGRIDLTQAEAVLDLIRAKSDRSVKAAMSQLEGSLSRRFRGLRDRLMKVYAHMEAYVDFPEEDIEVYADERFVSSFCGIKEEISKLIAGFCRGQLMREGLTCVIAGRPNAGKSSLFNSILERDRALVSEIAGTTRDMLEESIEIDGVHIRLVDTAGLGLHSSNPLDNIGMERTRQVLREAGMIIYLVDGSSELSEQDRKLYQEISGTAKVLTVINKSDLPMKMNLGALSRITGEENFVRISSISRTGFEQLERLISESVLTGRLEQESAQITRLRHKQALENALTALSRAEEAFLRRESLDLVTLDIKEALDSLSELIGEIYSEDLLDVIFSEFCIGK